MNLIDKRILDFIKKQKLFTLATCVDNKPHCSICYYAYSEELNTIIFKSSKKTNHVIEAQNNNNVALAISNDTKEIINIKGVQIEGLFFEPNENQITAAKKSYYLKFPFAITFSGEIWIIELTKIKFTDNSLGFSKKLVWEK
ncbi:MAG: pyridoxamine 5'-phosphate oxidase family protein [Bacteroidia bacterium]